MTSVVRFPQSRAMSRSSGRSNLCRSAAAARADPPEACGHGFMVSGRNSPIGGGGYHRLLPGSLTRYFASQAMANAPFRLGAAEFGGVWHCRVTEDSNLA